MTRKVRQHPEFAKHLAGYKDLIRTGGIFKGIPHEAALGIRDSLVKMYGETAVGPVPDRGRHLEKP